MKTEGMSQREAMLAVAQGHFVTWGGSPIAVGFEYGRLVGRAIVYWPHREDADIGCLTQDNAPFRIAKRPPKKEPERNHEPYAGPIRPGMHFIWEPDLPEARCEVRVLDIEVGTDDWPIIVAQIPPDLRVYRNPIKRFREACVVVETPKEGK